MKKFLFYLTFIALAMYCAEIISYNAPNILFEPTAYVGYGVLYVFFIHSLITRKVTKWSTVYFYGMLVGIITEAFLPKVLFFGWEAESFRLFGIAWFELFILTFFYHPFFSFIVPVFIAKKWLNFPFALETKNYAPRIIIPVIVMTIITVGNTYLNGGGQFIQALSSTIVLLIFIIVLKRVGTIKDITISYSSRVWFFAISAVMYLYIFFFYKVPHGGVLPEFGALIFILLFISGIFLLIRRDLPDKYDAKNIREIEVVAEEVSYTRSIYVEEKIKYKANVNDFRVVISGIVYVSVMILGSLLPIFMAQIIPSILMVALFAGVIVGGIYFVKCLFVRKLRSVD